jgi:hypothetical protein
MADGNGVPVTRITICNTGGAPDIPGIALSRESLHTENLADAIRMRIKPLAGIELHLPEREPMREPPVFE